MMKNLNQLFCPNLARLIHDQRIIWVISDTHFYHKNICYGITCWDKSSSTLRQFDNEVDMTDYVIGNINKLVGQEDVLIHLGDWSFGGQDKIAIARDRILCKNIFLIYGNHDLNIRANKKYQDLFSWCGDYLEIVYKKQHAVMTHYPIASWNNQSESVHLFGHTHHNYKSLGRSIDVGVDGHNLSPILLDHAIDLCKQKSISKVDHH